MKEIIEKLEKAFNELGIERIENLELLLKLSNEDIEKQTDLSYQVTPVFESLLKLSKIYTDLDDDEENELLAMNQTDFFSKIHYVTRLSDHLLEILRSEGMIHPVLATDFEFNDMLDSEEDCLSILAEIEDILLKMEELKEEEEDEEFEENDLNNPIPLQISTYRDRVVGYYQMIFNMQVVPELRDDMFEENYEHALEKLSDYVDFKLKLLAGLNDSNSLYLSDIAKNLHESIDSEIVEDIYNRIEIEKENFDPEDLEDEEYFQLLILKFENRYHKQKSCGYYYSEGLTEVESYKEKCKKL